MNKTLKNFENWEVHHKILLFASVLIAAILIVRVLVYYVINPNPIIFGLELHHFDYGLFILIITILFMLFVGRYQKTYLILSGISIGLIVDELWFVRSQVHDNTVQAYNPSFGYVLIVAIILVIIAVLIHHFFTKPRNK